MSGRELDWKTLCAQLEALQSVVESALSDALVLWDVVFQREGKTPEARAFKYLYDELAKVRDRLAEVISWVRPRVKWEGGGQA